jgi:hypothetical protein
MGKNVPERRNINCKSPRADEYMIQFNIESMIHIGLSPPLPPTSACS